MSKTAESAPEPGATPIPSAEADPAHHPSPDAVMNATTALRAGNGCSIDPNGGSPQP